MTILSNKLIRLMKDKKTSLCFSADFTLSNDLFKWINIVGPHICVLKTHIDILEDFSNETIKNLIELKNKYNFLILEDRKFGDIGKTFQKQLNGGIYRISEWCDIITIHGVCANGILEMLKEQKNNNIKTPNVLIVSEMSSNLNIIDKNYTYNCYNIGLNFNDIVLGFIAQKRIIKTQANDFLFFTPGINLIKSKEKDQIYKTPEEVYKNGTNIIIVGSAIYNSKDMSEILKYKYDILNL